MTLQKKNQKWLTVLSGFAFYFFMMGLTANCFSLYIIPVTNDLGFTRGQFSVAQTMIFMAGILCPLVAPKLYKKFGIITVMRAAAVGCGTCYFLQSLASRLWQFYLGSFFGGVCMQLCTFMPMAILIGEWFDENKNTAIGMASLGSGLGGSLLNILCSRIITDFGWRASFRWLGIACVIFSCIPAFLLLKREPEAAAREAAERAQKQSAPAAAEKKEKVKVPGVIYRFGSVSILINISACVILYSSIPYLQDIGYSTAFAAAVSSGAMIALAVGKFLYGVLLDKLGFVTCFRLSQLSAIFGLAVLVFFRASWMVALLYGAILCTCSYGSVGIPAAAELLSRGKDTNECMGVIMSMGSIGASLSSTIAGYVFDFTGSYVPLFVALIVCVGATVIIADRILKSV